MNTEQTSKNIFTYQENYCQICNVSNITVRWRLTMAHLGSGVRLQDVSTESMTSPLASLQKIMKALVNGIVKFTILLKNQTLRESLKK